ncbi:Integrase catalytic core [Arabidopsis suecica]|uniref:Integrase catalytic core n=1 Tax=Arabidopsis suecica TaxID=45249 RepID=A0A8T2BC28_ARASU|nr:Integrase catalytic core [Arabidopsis suecica]
MAPGRPTRRVVETVRRDSSSSASSRLTRPLIEPGWSSLLSVGFFGVVSTCHRAMTSSLLLVAMSTTKERSSHNRNKRLIEALTTEMGQIFYSHLDSIRQGHHRARKRKEQELKPKPSDNSLRSSRRSLQKIPHTLKSKSVFHSDYKPTNALFKFSGKEDYLEWEKNMDEWFSYKNFLSEMRFVCALSYLTGDAYKWWLQEVDDRLYYKEPPITFWRDLKELLRNKYAPQASNRSRKVSVTAQGLAVQEKEQVLVLDSKKNPIAEKQFEDELLKILNAYNKPKKAKSTPQPKMVTEEVVVHKQSLNPSLESSGEPKQCHTMENENDKAEGSTKEENHHLVSTTSQACRADYVSNITIFKAEILPNILRGNQVSLASEFIQYWNNFTFTRTFKQPVLNVGISSIIHLILSLSAKEDAGTINVCNDMPTNSEHMTCSLAIKESEDVNNTILKEKEPPYVSQQVLNRELPKEATRELGGFTQAKAVLVHNQSPRAECNILVKEKPPDATPPIKTRGNYLNSQKRMKANLLSLGEGCTIWRPIKKTTDREISTHHMSQSRDSREDYQNQLRLKHKEECIGKQSNLFVRASKDKNALLSKHQCLLLNCEKALMSLTNLTPVLPSEMMSLLQDYEGMLSEEKSIGLPTIHDASQSRIWRPGLGRSRPIPYESLVTLLHMFPEEPKMDLSSFGSFHTYQWRPGELLDSSREEELVTNNALIKEESLDPTSLPLTVMISSTEHTANLVQVSNSLTRFVSHVSRTFTMILSHLGNIEKKLDLFKEYLETNSCLRTQVKHEDFKDNALIKAEPCLLVYSDSMTVITHLLFAKAGNNIAGTKEEPPDLEILSSNLFERTGIGVVLMPNMDNPFNRTRRKSDNAYELELQGKFNVSSNFKDSYLVLFIVGELDLRSNPFQVGEDDMILETTKDLECDKELVAEEELEPEEQLEPGEHFERDNELVAEKEPNTIDPVILNERREQDKVFGLLLTLSSTYNDLIKHLLRAEKLPNLEEVCSQIQKEQGSLGLFGNKGELAMANKGELTTANKGSYKSENKRGLTCDHCKKTGHTKEKCWILHPHLRPSKWKDPKAHQANWSQETQDTSGPGSSTQANGVGMAMTASSEYVKRSDLDALIKALKESSGNSYHALVQTLKPLIVDSGASHHMISDSRLMNNIEPALGNVVIANGDKIPVKGIGDLELFDKKSKAFYMPNFTSNLLSVKRATTDLNCYAIFGPNDVHFQDIESSRVLGQGVTKDGLYVLEDTKLSEPLSSHFSSSIVIANSAIWHARLGHPHPRALSLMLPKVSFQSLDCEACILGKHCKAIFPKSSTIYESCFDLIHSDVWTSPCLSRENQKYFVTFIDEKSKYTWLTLLPSKDRVLEAFKNFHTYVTNQYNAKIKIFRSDNGGEYTSQAFKEHLALHGIIHQTSCPYTPQQNGVSERKNRHLMEIARSIMFHTNVPKRFWSDAVMTACYLINRTPTKILQDKSPFEVLTKTKPSLDHLRVFGCVCYVLVPGDQRNKLQAKSTKGMFIGYSTTQKGYKCYVPESRKVLVSRDVKFVEEKGFYDKKDWESLKDLSSSPSDRATNLRIILEKLGIENHQPSNTQAPHPPQGQEEESLEEEEVQDIHNGENDPNIQEEDHIPDGDNELNQEEDETSQEVTQEVTQDVIPLRRSERLRFHPSTWKDKRVYYNANAVAHPIQAVCTLAHLPEEHQVYLSKVDQHWIPTTYEEAIQHQVWRDAIEAEKQAMINNHTWDEGDLPRGRKAVTSKWVFTIKYKSDGEIERYKARLVARGFTQKYGEDYLDTFAPVAKLHTVRVVLSLATNLEWDLWQMDVKNAFLQGELEEEVYMRPPPGLEDKEAPGKVLKLNKAIYGLKQSPRAWYHKLSTTLLGRGFKRSEADHTLFTLPSQEGIVVILVYVDDIIISGNDKVGIQDTKDFLKSVFDIKDLGELKYFLGIEVCRSKEGLFLSQRKYTLDLLDEVGKLGAKPAKTPLEDDYKARRKGEHDNKPFGDPTKYRRLVGKLIYLTITRPDICFAVNVVSQQMQAPTQHHWNMVNRILKYLKGAPGQGIWMGCNRNTEIVGYCDADYAGDKNDRRSTTGYCTFIGGNLVTWRSKKQKVVSLSSAEAEYRAMRKLTTELMWLKALLKDFGIDTPQPITMHCDNQAAIHIATNSVFHERTKHIEVDCHKVREQIQLGVILPHYTESEEQLADIFTKGASTKFYPMRFSTLRFLMRWLNLDPSLTSALLRLNLRGSMEPSEEKSPSGSLGVWPLGHVNRLQTDQSLIVLPIGLHDRL